jgi:maleylpyruvate isomerase
VDLGLAYTADDWPEAFALRMAHTLAGDYTRRPDGPRLVIRSPEVGRDLPLAADVTSPVVSGPVRTAVAWLIGRSDGDGLTVQPPGSLPAVPVWS